MRFIFLAVIAFVALAPTAAQAKTWTITHDEGGYLQIYYEKVQAINKRQDLVRIDGPCVSACTMYLGADRLCITDRAAFYFHAARATGKMTKADWELVRRWDDMTLPAWVHKWIKDNDAYASVASLKLMPAAYAMKYIPKCK